MSLLRVEPRSFPVSVGLVCADGQRHRDGSVGWLGYSGHWTSRCTSMCSNSDG
jgi:hypothetical protein